MKVSVKRTIIFLCVRKMFSVGNFKNKGVSSICIVAIEEICLKNQIVKEKEVIFIIVGLEIIYRSHQHVSQTEYLLVGLILLNYCQSPTKHHHAVLSSMHFTDFNLFLCLMKWMTIAYIQIICTSFPNQVVPLSSRKYLRTQSFINFNGNKPESKEWIKPMRHVHGLSL